VFTNFSSRKFKVNHVNRLRALKRAYKSHDVKKSIQVLVVEALEIGLRDLEEQVKLPQVVDELPGVQIISKRVVPFGIKETQDEG